METFEFGEGIYEHAIGDPNCSVCWSSPVKCESCKDGLVHDEFGDENYDGDYWTYKKCDKCGEVP